jgi:phytoene dehydrogenase-like protein
VSPSPVVVVGAGHNGLVCAAHLARAGLRVVVLEQAERPGGAVASHVQSLPGFVHDDCAGFFPLTLASRAFDGLGVRERVSWINPAVAMAHPFADGTAIALHRDVGATRDSLEASAPGAGRAWEALVTPLLRERETVLRAALSPFPPLRPGIALALRLRRELAAEGWCPAVRMGVHTGTAVQRGGDWYGSAVNVAARVADAAAAGEVLLSVATRERIARAGVSIADRGARTFKNVAAPLAVFAAAAA